MERVALLSVLALAAAVTIVTAQKCADIDTSACQLLQASRPDLCTDPTLSQSACPRFCKLCPVECYHCNATVMDFHECNTTRLCSEGQVCMKKELHSFVDGHHEYQMTCERKELCDGAGVAFPFVGKRSVESRDVSLTCCADDLCNYPGSMMTTTTPSAPPVTMTALAACKRDVIFVVDESTHMSSHEPQVLQFLKDMTSKLPIGSNAALVSMATYSSTARTRWDLDAYTTNADLQQAVQNMVFNTGGSGDNAVAVKYLENHALSSRAGDRPGVPDAVVIITADSTSHTFANAVLETRLHRDTSDVIVIALSQRPSSADLNHLATDNGHVFQLSSDDLLRASEGKIYDLICPKI